MSAAAVNLFQEVEGGREGEGSCLSLLNSLEESINLGHFGTAGSQVVVYIEQVARNLRRLMGKGQ